jgi:predicted AAA+ superfamily ATPase
LLKYDLPLLRDIDKPFKLKTIFDILIYETGNITPFQNIAVETGISQATVENYLNYLEEAFLISVLDNYSKSLRPKKRRLKKVYIASTNFIAAVQPLVDQNILIQPFQGHLVETDVFNKLNIFAKVENLFLSFWRKKQEEADFILGRKENQLVCEVKYSSKIKSNDLKGLLLAMDRLKAKHGLILTRNQIDCQRLKSKELYFIPAFLL